MPPESTHTPGFELNVIFYSSWYLAKRGGAGNNVLWFCHSQQGLDPEIVCDARLKSRITYKCTEKK